MTTTRIGNDKLLDLKNIDEKVHSHVCTAFVSYEN